MSSDQDIEDRAAQWLARMDRQNESGASLAEFEAWCRADPRNLAAYLRLLEAWNRLDALNTEVPESLPRTRIG